jgi:putative IMPACT (imprinted ancient) family translation regulator
MVVSAVGRGRRVPVHVVMLALPYNLLERVRSLAALQHAQILEEDFAADITMTLHLPVDSFDVFQHELRDLSAGKIQPEILETTETIIALK